MNLSKKILLVLFLLVGINYTYAESLDTYSDEASLNSASEQGLYSDETSLDTNSVTESGANTESDKITTEDGEVSVNTGETLTGTEETLTGTDLNSAGPEVNSGTVLSGANLANSDIKETPELAAKKAKKLPKTGPTEWLLLILALGLGIIIIRFKKA